ncbi:hypothetical protein [Kitasatospora cineracea]|uniref:hypothetical protein n=1 Tax=Kitasatospora cineracea TaxID=88074 RepID=UPI001FCA1185|nr:hypothetical protein [Kitasatospora cineracea]
MLYPRDHYDLAELPDELAAETGRAHHPHRPPQSRPCRTSPGPTSTALGDGAAHLHLWFFARPAGQLQLFGSWLPVWDDLLPEYPADAARADAETVADALTASYGGRRTATA